MTAAQSNKPFANRTAIVTGASRGIGFGIARRLVDLGARVCITARTATDLQRAVEALGGPDHAIAVAGRGDDPEHQSAAVEATVAAFGPIDHLVNNTGANPVYGPMIELDLAAARKVVEVNCLSALGWTQRVYAASLAEHGGSVVNIASVAGLRASTGIGFYGSSKAMLIHMTRQLAMELGPHIRVNCVAPAVVKTDFAIRLYENREDEVAAAYPLKRLGTPEDVAATVTHLLSPEAGWITGQVVAIDGGALLGTGS